MTNEFLINQKGSVQDISCSLKLSLPDIEHLHLAIANEKENKNRTAVLKMLERALRKVQMFTPKTGVELIAEERTRQIEEEGWTHQNDNCYVNGELADAAACYAMSELQRKKYQSWNAHTDTWFPRWWPWNSNWWKPTPDDRIRELQKAGALIAAEIDRLTSLKKLS